MRSTRRVRSSIRCRAHVRVAAWRTVTRTIALPLLLALAAYGCERLQHAIEEKTDEVAEHDSEADHDDHEEGAGLLDEEKLARKLDLYAACIDRSRARIAASWTRYADDIDPETGLRRRKSGQPFVYTIGKELDPCHEADERGRKLSPALPEIESAMTAYLEASERYADLTRILHAYYEAEAYDDDEWAQGKELAPELAAAYETWSGAAQQLVDAVSGRRDEVAADMLVLIEAREGKGLRWHAKNLSIAAKTFRKCVERPDWTPQGCQKAFDALREAHDGFRATHDDRLADAKKVFWMLAYQTTADEYMEEAASLMGGFAKAKPKARLDAVDSLTRIHDDLASDHANLKFDFP
jgi:hypothetical protein